MATAEDISLIVPYVYIGNRYAATGRFGPDGYIDYLHRNRIQHVISALTDEEYADYIISAEDFADQRAWHRLTVDDESAEPISRFFPQMVEVITDAVAAKQPVLVHCAAGMSRSVSIVAAFLIATQGLAASEAVALIQKKRPIAGPNRGFIRQLGEWEAKIYDTDK
jgi:protein-tyrosine phosphatase